MRRWPTRWQARCLAAFALLLAPPALAQGASTTGVGSQFELTYWQSVESGNDPALYEAYLAQYPNGTFAVVARVKLAKLRQAAVPAPAPAPIAPPLVPAPAPAPIAPKVEPVPQGDAGSAPNVSAAVPTQPEPQSSESDALRRLLGALGESQRTGAPAPARIVDTPEVVPAPQAAPLATPAAAPSRLVEAGGPVVTVPDAVQLSLTATPATAARQIAVGPLPPGFALPPRPRLAVIPPLVFPASFCSAEARNAFHDGPYVTAVEAAKRNNDAAIAYLHQLQDLYDTNQLSGDTNPVNAIAAEAQSYSPVAAAAFAAQSTLVNAFSTLMAVPIRPCDMPKQP